MYSYDSSLVCSTDSDWIHHTRFQWKIGLCKDSGVYVRLSVPFLQHCKNNNTATDTENGQKQLTKVVKCCQKLQFTTVSITVFVVNKSCFTPAAGAPHTDAKGLLLISYFWSSISKILRGQGHAKVQHFIRLVQRSIFVSKLETNLFINKEGMTKVEFF